MNKIYRLVWNTARHAWVVTGELTRAHKKTVTVSAALVLCSTVSVAGAADTQYITLPGDGSVVTLGTANGPDGANGGDGGAAYVITPGAGTAPELNKVVVDLPTWITGGSSNGGNGGAAIEATGLTIDNSGYIDGGYGIERENGGTGISGSYLNINNNNYIRGGATDAGLGGTGVSGDNLNIVNANGLISGGYGGKGGDGGTAIRGHHLTITNLRYALIDGGYGGNSNTEYGGKGSAKGGVGVAGNFLKIDNRGTIQGGPGGDQSPDGSNGGVAVTGTGLRITNSGDIRGGSCGTGSSGACGAGGAGVSGDSLVVTNSGNIHGGYGSQGSDALSGSNLTITNSGVLLQGPGVGGHDGAAVRLTAGANTLTLDAGSVITGDIVLLDTKVSGGNTLSIISNATTTVSGDLLAGSGTGVALSGEQLVLDGDASFGDGSTLAFATGTSLKAYSASFTDTTLITSVTDWKLDDILLVTTLNGVTGTETSHVYNPLLTEGAKDYAGILTSEDGKDLLYTLAWNNTRGDGYGTFDLKDGTALNLGVVLKDNASSNVNGWDGRSLTKAGPGTLSLSEQNTYTGSTTVTGGMLTLATPDAISQTSGVTVKQAGILNLAGNSQTLNTVNNQGTLLISSYGTEALKNAVTVTGDMVNSGLLVMDTCTSCTGQTYKQDGNWTGEGGTVSMGVTLGDDASQSDRLVITGAVTGTTQVAVTNRGGSGAQTLEGIKLIETGSSTSDAFSQKGRIVAGSYEYRLQKGSAGGNNQNDWYLTSLTGGGSGGDTGDGDSGGGDVGGGDTGGGSEHTWRPERGSYAANLAAAGTLFNTRLSDRQGGGVWTDPVTGVSHESSLWARTSGGHREGQMSDDQSSYTANRMVFQLGGDVLNGSFSGDDRWHLGLMAGYGSQDSKTRSAVTGYASRGSVSGYSAGLYGTWYQNAAERTGLYVDSWALYNWFDNTVKGDGLAYEKYDSRGVTASLESGYVFRAGAYTTTGGMENTVYLRPQAQVIWSGVKADRHTEQNGTTVEGLGDGNLQTRLGVRLSSVGQSRPDAGTVRRFEPFVEVNWLYASEQYGVKMGDADTHIRGSRNVAEMKAGVEGRVSENLSLWGNVSQQMGSQGYRDTQGVLGLKYGF